MLYFPPLLYAFFCIKFRISRAPLWLNNKFIRLALKKSSLKSDEKNISLPFKPISFESTPSRLKPSPHVPQPCWSGSVFPTYGMCQLQEFQQKSTHLKAKNTHVHVAWSQEHMMQTVPFHSRIWWSGFAGIRLRLLGKPRASIKIPHPTQTWSNG